MNDLFHTTQPHAHPIPTRAAALAAIDRVQPAAYARTRNRLDGAVTGLSPWISHGIVTLHEVLERIDAREPLPVQHKLVYELGWRAYFRHVWQQRGDGILQSFHEGPLPEARYLATLPDDVREARTGLAVIDQAVRTLYATGTLHNHARMWLASYVVHLRHVHWRAGADWMLAHLLDGDLASNHLSWQWIAGTSSGRPYLFDAANVARNAPPSWHVQGSALDVPYATLERIARGHEALQVPDAPDPPDATTTPEPALHSCPPAELGVLTAADVRTQVRGRDVWLVHPWALRAPQDSAAGDVLRIGIHPAGHHARWPWTAVRWHWVDRAMREVTHERWTMNAGELAAALGDAASVRTAADPHIERWLPPCVRVMHERAVFPEVERTCSSFSQWWTRTTRGVRMVRELL